MDFTYDGFFLNEALQNDSRMIGEIHFILKSSSQVSKINVFFLTLQTELKLLHTLYFKAYILKLYIFIFYLR